MIKEEFVAKLGKNMKTTTTRLGELTKQRIITKIEVRAKIQAKIKSYLNLVREKIFTIF